MMDIKEIILNTLAVVAIGVAVMGLAGVLAGVLEKPYPEVLDKAVLALAAAALLKACK